MISRQVQLTSVVLIAITACTVQVQGGEEDSTKQRRARLQNMTDAEKQALLEKKRLFYELPREEQQQLKKLHEQLVQDPECDRLRITLERIQSMAAYAATWRASSIDQPASQRASGANPRDHEKPGDATIPCTRGWIVEQRRQASNSTLARRIHLVTRSGIPGFDPR